ncbi:MAG TPA: cytochrome c oxidase subunit 3, partial [Phycisphaerales bacterium]|nr:cytochrome c oxidase subunit 3 [Phycisphaerales bacterium]
AGLGTWVFLIVVGVLFVSGIIAFVAVRIHYRDYWPGNLPSLPKGLWLSTALLAAGSFSLWQALLSARRDQQEAVGRWMLVSVLLGLAFCASQTACWLDWKDELLAMTGDTQTRHAALSAFGVLTGLHAAHVMGGLVPMILVTSRAMHGRYSREHHTGVSLCGMYWHFLGAMWVMILGTLLVLE